MTKEIITLAQRAREARKIKARIAAKEKREQRDATIYRQNRIANRIAKKVVKAALKGETTVDVCRRPIGMLHTPYEPGVYDAVNEKLEHEGVQVTPTRRTYVATPLSGFAFLQAPSYVDKEMESVQINLVPSPPQELA